MSAGGTEGVLGMLAGRLGVLTGALAGDALLGELAGGAEGVLGISAGGVEEGALGALEGTLVVVSAGGAEGVLGVPAGRLGVLTGALAGALLGELAGGAEGALVPPGLCPPAGFAKASLASKRREIKNAASTATTTAKPRAPTWCQRRSDLVPKFSVALVNPPSPTLP